MSGKSGGGAYLFSPTLDGVAFVLPIALAVALSPYALTLPKTEVPLWAHFFLVIANDVAHVWGTAFRTYLDRRELMRRPALYVASPFLAFMVAFILHRAGSPAVFWTAMSYYAMYHFVKQDFGLLALFVARSGVRPTKGRMLLEKYTVYAGAGLPVLLWHAGPPEDFNWFSAGEKFVFTTPAALVLPLKVLYFLAAFNYLGWEAWYYRRDGHLNKGKLFVMGCTWLTWALGTFYDQEVLTLAWLNLFHGVPFMIMVGVYCRKRWATLPPSACTDQVIVLLTRRWYIFIPTLVLLAVVEDVLWDALVWQDYLPRLWTRYFPHIEGSLPELSDYGISVATAALSVPQIVHYILDGYIWRFDANPGLRDFLLGPLPDEQVRPAKELAAVPSAELYGAASDATNLKGLHRQRNPADAQAPRPV